MFPSSLLDPDRRCKLEKPPQRKKKKKRKEKKWSPRVCSPDRPSDAGYPVHFAVVCSRARGSNPEGKAKCHLAAFCRPLTRDAISFLPRCPSGGAAAAAGEPSLLVPRHDSHFRSRLGLPRWPWANGNHAPRLPHPRAPAFTPTNRRTCYLVNPRPSRTEGKTRREYSAARWRGNTEIQQRGWNASSTRRARSDLTFLAHSLRPLPRFFFFHPGLPSSRATLSQPPASLLHLDQAALSMMFPRLFVGLSIGARMETHSLSSFYFFFCFSFSSFCFALTLIGLRSKGLCAWNNRGCTCRRGCRWS